MLLETNDEVESNDGESETNHLEWTFAPPEEDPGADFEIIHEESFLGIAVGLPATLSKTRTFKF